MTYTVPDKSLWVSNAEYWFALLKTYTDANPNTGYENVYYDAQACVYALRDYVGSSTTFSTAMAQSFRSPYLYWLNTLGGGQGFRIFAKGLAEDYIRDNAQTTSRTAVDDLAGATPSKSPWAVTSAYNIAHLPDIYYSRETAYALEAHIEAGRCGLTPSTAWRDTLKGYAMGHITKWYPTQTDGLTKFYIRPFMVALTTEALISYHENVSALSSTEIAQIVALWEYIWNNLWNAGSAAGSNSFAYTDRATSTMSASSPNTEEQAGLYNTGDTESSVDLNLLIVPVFGWLWKQTGETKWQDRFTSIWNAGLTRYTIYGYWESGAFFGSQTTNGIIGKHVCQNYRWTAQAIAWVEGASVVSPGPNPAGSNAKNYYGLMMGVCGSSVVRYNLTGQVTLGGVGLAGVTISSVALGDTTTDSNGNFNYNNVTPATAYTITPSLTGYAFTPSSTSGTLNGDTTASFTAAVATYDPQDYYTTPTKRYWFYMNDTTKVLDASDASAANGVKIRTVNDEWGGSAQLYQATVGNQPTCTTNVSNSKQSALFTSAATCNMAVTNFASALNSATKVSFGVVFKLNSTGTNATFLRCYDNSYSHNRFRAYLATGNPSMDMTKDTTAATTRTANSWNSGVVTLATATVHAVLYEWDVANSSCQIYVDSHTATMSSTAAPGTSIANTTLNQPEVGLSSTNCDILDTFFVVGALMDSTQRAAWFAAAKTNWGITIY
jgi:hypothetical protein